MNLADRPAAVDPAVVERVLAAIDEASVVERALQLGGIDSPAGAEGEAAEFVYQWLDREGFAPRRLSLLPDRVNVVGRLPGRGSGCSLLFNSHLDTSVAADETLSTRHAADPIYHSAWRDGDDLFGNGLCNDKGQMAAWLAACKALKDHAAPLAGDLVLTSVCGEIELEPIDEFTTPRYASREAGSRYVINRGAIADYALVAAATAAHQHVFGTTPGMAASTITSLWRDLNAFAEAGIPCLMYGPGPSIGKGNFSMLVEDLVQAARLYALIALHVTSQPRAERPRAGADNRRPVS